MARLESASGQAALCGIFLESFDAMSLDQAILCLYSLDSLWFYNRCEINKKQKTNTKMQNNTNTVKTTMVPFIRDLVSLCAIHPANFVREIGKAESLKDTAKVVGMSKGSAIGPIVRNSFAKGTHKSILENETARWESLAGVANALGMRLNALLRACEVETGDSNAPALKAPQNASQAAAKV